VSNSWGRAEEIPGLAALNTGGGVHVNSLSCESPGSCAVAGSYRTRSAHLEAFVATETSGRWGSAEEVPGLAVLNVGNSAEVLSVSCGGAGNCAAGGVYADAAGHQQAFVVSEAGGAWGPAIEVPGLAVLNSDGSAAVTSVSCPATSDCAAAGYYTDADGYPQAFAVSERSGHWGTAIQLPFTGNGYYPNGYGMVSSLSCPSAGNCAAVGDDTGPEPTFGDESAFVVNETNGHWGTVRQVPGLAALNTGLPSLFSVSCASAGNCAAGGNYYPKSGHTEPFVVSEKNGAWGKAIEVPGSAAHDAGDDAEVTSVSCSTAGNCSAGGFTLGPHGPHGFVVSEIAGTWRDALVTPGTGTGSLSGGRNSEVLAVACARAGNCVAGGGSKDSSFRSQAFVLSRPCASVGACAAAGTYRIGATRTEGYVVSEKQA
jgi:hypothetical protein